METTGFVVNEMEVRAEGEALLRRAQAVCKETIQKIADFVVEEIDPEAAKFFQGGSFNAFPFQRIGTALDNAVTKLNEGYVIKYISTPEIVTLMAYKVQAAKIIRREVWERLTREDVY
ncbi:MAG: hypothetical protein HYV45_01905 [Candidatus Moranbacteria bacterium]|nr:hypothetical protein [Candidatus Moranbacteria bacterium]